MNKDKDKLSSKLKLAFRSKTFWTLVVLFVINGVTAIHSSIPANLVPVVDGVLAILATYFHVNPSQNYNNE